MKDKTEMHGRDHDANGEGGEDDFEFGDSQFSGGGVDGKGIFDRWVPFNYPLDDSGVLGERGKGGGEVRRGRG